MKELKMNFFAIILSLLIFIHNAYAEQKCCFGSCWANGCCPPNYDCPESKPKIKCHCINLGLPVDCREVNISEVENYSETVTNTGTVMEFLSQDQQSILRCMKTKI